MSLSPQTKPSLVRNSLSQLVGNPIPLLVRLVLVTRLPVILSIPLPILKPLKVLLLTDFPHKALQGISLDDVTLSYGKHVITTICSLPTLVCQALLLCVCPALSRGRRGFSHWMFYLNFLRKDLATFLEENREKSLKNAFKTFTSRTLGRIFVPGYPEKVKQLTEKEREQLHLSIKELSKFCNW